MILKQNKAKEQKHKQKQMFCKYFKCQKREAKPKDANTNPNIDKKKTL